MVESLIVILVVGAAAAYTARWMWRSLRPEGGCGCGSKKCPGEGAGSDRGLRRVPLVELGVKSGGEEKGRGDGG